MNAAPHPRPWSAVILAVGSEITEGHIVNTNAAWISRRLSALGVATAYHLSLPDAPDALLHHFRAAWNEGLSLIVTGGIGPTEDDRTREVIAALLDAPLETDPDSLKRAHKRYAAAGPAAPAFDDREAGIPRGATALANNFGTAAGIGWFEEARFLITLPGVPRELYGMWDAVVKPALTARYEIMPAAFEEVLVFGAYEARVNEEVRELLQPRRGVSASILAADTIITLRWTSFDPARGAELRALADKAARRLGDRVFMRRCQDTPALAPGVDPLAACVVEMLAVGGKRVSCAESCSGGLLAELLTAVPGASRVFDLGIVSYANRVKSALLGVDKSILDECGAVSSEVVEAMAAGALKLGGADIGVSLSGIAGPDGGTDEKPVGTVWIGLATQDARRSHRFHFNGDRALIRQRAAHAALNLVRLTLLDGKPPEVVSPALAP